MAFFGLKWVPKVEKEIRASEADTVQLASLVGTIRAKGLENAVGRKYQLEQVYGQLYGEYMSKQEERQQWDSYAGQLLAQYPANIQTVIASAANFWKNGDSQYYSYLQSNPLSNQAHNAIAEYAYYLELKDWIDGKEKELWMLNYHTENTRVVHDLWQFETDNALRAKKKVTEDEKQDKQKQKDRRKFLEVKIKTLRRENHDAMIANQLKDKQATAKGTSKTKNKSRKQEFVRVDGEAQQILDFLPDFTPSATPSRNVDTSSSSNRKSVSATNRLAVTKGGGQRRSTSASPSSEPFLSDAGGNVTSGTKKSSSSRKKKSSANATADFFSVL